MTTLSADINVNAADPDVIHLPVVASDIIYAGALVSLNGSGYAIPLTVTNRFVGINVGGKADNSSGAAGDINVVVARRKLVKLTVAGFTSREQHGAMVFATDDATLTLTQGAPGASTLVGKIVEYAASGVAYVLLDADLELDQANLGAAVPAQITTAAAVAFTPAQLLAGFVKRDPAGAGRADTVPSAASVLAARGKFGRVGDNFEFTIQNDADADETITVTADSGATVTLAGTMTIAQNYARRFRYVQTAAATATIYSLGTYAF